MTARRNLPREAEDALLLALAAVMVPATWRLLLGWSWDDLIPGHDGIATVFLAIRELVEAHGRWSDLVYRADLFGGMKLRDAVGPLPALSLLARLPLSPTAVFNILTFLIQVVIAFLGVRAAADIARVVDASARRPTWLERAAGVWMCGFAPALAWRLGYGHHTLVVGGLPFAAMIALLAAAGAGTVSLTLLIVAAAALVNGVMFTGHQMVLYGAVFGGPILLGLWLTCGGRLRPLRVPALACLGAFLIALPGLWAVLAHAAGSDSLRSLGRMKLTYAWLTSEPFDWLTSIPWTRLALPVRPVLFHHEINYAAGPLLALLALVPWRRAQALGAGLASSVVLVLLFSMNVRPFSDALLILVPPLNTFRVPPRAILPALSLLPVLVLAAVLVRPQPRMRMGAAAAALAAGGVFFLLPSLAREALGWAVVLGFVALLRPKGRRDLPALAWAALLMTMAAGSVAAFRERLLPFVPGEAALARARAMGDAALLAQPALASPLVRAGVGPEAEFEANTAFAARLSALDGYFFPSRRFVELVCALRGQAYQPNQLIVRLPEDHSASRPLFQLYDVAWRVQGSPSAAGAVDVRPLTTPAGPAWFSAGVTRTDSFASLGRDLLALGDDLGRRARESLWLVSTDPAVASARLPASVDGACAGARVREVRAHHGEAGASALVEAPADCPLTFAMSYADTLRAAVRGSAGGGGSVPVFPAYGALAGVWVPRGTTEVRVQAVPPALPLPAAWTLAGVLALWCAARHIRRGPG